MSSEDKENILASDQHNTRAASDDKELPPGYEAIYSVENTHVETENIHIRPPMMMGMAESPSNTSHPLPPAFSSHLHPPPPPLSQPQQAIFVQQPVFVRPLMFSKKSQAMICPNCSANIMSQTKHETGLANWLVAGGVCLIGAWCGCCLIPFCIDGLKDVEHYCPNCRAMMGRYKRI